MMDSELDVVRTGTELMVKYGGKRKDDERKDRMVMRGQKRKNG